MRYVSLANDRVMINNLLETVLDSGYSDFWVKVGNRPKSGKLDYYSVIEEFGVICLRDSEDPEELWVLTKDKMIDGFRVLDEKNQEAFERISKNHGEWDAEDADQWLQYSLFERIVYS